MLLALRDALGLYLHRRLAWLLWRQLLLLSQLGRRDLLLQGLFATVDRPHIDACRLRHRARRNRARSLRLPLVLVELVRTLQETATTSIVLLGRGSRGRLSDDAARRCGRATGSTVAWWATGLLARCRTILLQARTLSFANRGAIWLRASLARLRTRLGATRQGTGLRTTRLGRAGLGSARLETTSRRSASRRTNWT